MAGEDNQSVVLVGGPDAGKTNFLGRLWMTLDSESGAIRKNGLPRDVEYLRGIAHSLNAGEFAQRTPPGVFESTAIRVNWGQDSVGNLVVPDCAGEQWERIHREREWSTEWEQAVGTMTGCLVFFRGTSAHNVEPLDWSADADLMRCLAEGTNDEERRTTLPTQVILVDWLQCLSSAFRELRGTENPLRVSIVLSAWDLAPIECRDADPAGYLSRNLPLLDDFLAANQHLFSSKPFGVSIAGGELTANDTPFMKRFLEGDPAAQGYVVVGRNGSVSTSTDFTLPVAWAFGVECPDFDAESTPQR